MRLRCTAKRTCFFAMTRPKRAGAAASVMRTNKSREAWEALSVLPSKTALYSRGNNKRCWRVKHWLDGVRGESRACSPAASATGSSVVDTQKPKAVRRGAAIRPSDACGLWRDGGSIRCGRFWWPCEHGNRVCACASKRWAGMYACSCCTYLSIVDDDYRCCGFVEKKEAALYRTEARLTTVPC
jgi:hypothetical protein